MAEKQDATQQGRGGRREYRVNVFSEMDKTEHQEYVSPVIVYLRNRLRKQLGLSLNDISLRTQHTYNTIQRLLSGGVLSPSFYDIVRLADAAGTSLNFLGETTTLYHPENITDHGAFDDNDQPLVLSPDEAELIRHLRTQLSAAERKVLLDNIRERVETVASAQLGAKSARSQYTQRKQQTKRTTKPSDEATTPGSRSPVPTGPRNC